MLTHEYISDYIQEIVNTANKKNIAIQSILLFGSAAKYDFTSGSDIDLLIITENQLSDDEEKTFKAAIVNIEQRQGFKKVSVNKNLIEKFIDRAGGNDLSFFITSKAILLSGDAGRILSLSPFEARFVNRIVLASIIIPAVTVWGEDLKYQIPLQPIRKIDVIKAFFSFINLMLFIVFIYPVLKEATRHAMGILKRSIHSCYFCFTLKADTLQKEVDFFTKQLNISAPREVINLRQHYRPSFRFVLRSCFAIIALHFFTLRKNSFPKYIPVKCKAGNVIA